jgi:uroporphyrin-III C-methyltransferase/precorrin-2 dehydrogenase/sirohydrochlorin ferrochelatase
VSGLAKICAGLIEHGLARDLPAALVEKATWPEQRVIEGTLATLPKLAEQGAVKAPSLLIVGEVVRLRSRLGWFRGERAGAESQARVEED